MYLIQWSQIKQNAVFYTLRLSYEVCFKVLRERKLKDDEREPREQLKVLRQKQGRFVALDHLILYEQTNRSILAFLELLMEPEDRELIQ